MSKVLLFFFSCFFVIGCTNLNQLAPTQPITSDNDNKHYKALTLPNQLKVLLISDPDTEKAAASLDLHIGSRQDPKQSQGLAHFLEHMLFLGTEKYPEPGAYQAFINNHGGRHNAYTAFEHTNYFFDVSPQYLEPALDRFSQFFIAPLFTQTYVEREKNAVHSEYTSKLKNDARKSLDVFKHIINQQHPFSKFSVGNLDTLSSTTEGELKQELLDFYQQYYSANLMTLVVIGRESLPELEQWVVDKFSAVNNSEVVLEDIKQPLFKPGDLPLQVNIKPEQEQRILSLSFPVADVYTYYREKPLSYLGNILGHEGEGSLLSYLKAKGWAEGLAAGAGFSYRGGAAFGVTIKLTSQGLQQQQAVISAVFETINRIREQGLQPWLYQEQQDIAQLRFRYKESVEPINYARSLASDLHYYPVVDLLRGPYMMADYDEALIKQYLAKLTPDNLLVTVTAPEVTVNAKSPFYQTDYLKQKIEPALLAQWQAAGLNEQILLPKSNEFIADDFTLIPSSRDKSATPEMLLNQTNNKWWFKNDDEFNIPKGFLSLSIRSAKASVTAREAVQLRLYSKILREQVNEYAYPASLAGLNYSIKPHMRGISLKVSGFNQKQALLFNKLLAALVTPKLDAATFLRLKTDLQRDLENAARQQPYHMLMGDLPEYLYAQLYSEQQLLAALGSVDLPQLQEFVQEFLAAVDLNGLIYGNYSKQQALSIMHSANALLVVPEAGFVLPETQVYRLQSPAISLQTENAYQDSALLFYVQAKDKKLSTTAAFEVAAQLYKPSFYTQLRTEKQLGYIVTSGTYPAHKVPGFFFMVQSPSVSAATIQREILAYLEQKQAELDILNESQFNAAKQVIIEQLSQKPTNLGESQNRYWQDIAYNYYEFDSRQQLIEALTVLDFASWQQLMRQQLLTEQRQGMWLYSKGKFEGDAVTAKPVENIEAFQAQRRYYSFP